MSHTIAMLEKSGDNLFEVLFVCSVRKQEIDVSGPRMPESIGISKKG
jgi:hypothetical protein